MGLNSGPHHGTRLCLRWAVIQEPRSFALSVRVRIDNDILVVRKLMRQAPILRGEHARQRILRAALDVVAEHGLPGFTMEAVAQRAAASKTTLYRRWASREELLVEAMDELASRPFPLPATGDLRSDLIELMRMVESLLNEQPFPRLMAAFIDAAERDPTLQRMHATITESRRRPIRHVLVEARLRGELPSSADLELAIDLLTAPAFYRRFIAHQPLNEAYAAAVVDQVLAALGAGPRAEPRPARR
jgi:AcrR family transcriptional regulator